jgi:SAM-dependent methyltransferase
MSGKGMKPRSFYSSIPFAEPGDDQAINANKGRRVRIVREFIGKDLSKLHTLDIGEPNAFGRLLEMEDNTTGNLNYELVAPSKQYDLILFSEIIEHIMNPLGRLRDCYHLLQSRGILIVSTPIANRIFMQSPHHLTEYQPKRFRRMLEYAGFKVVKYRTICIWDWWPFMFTGIRPFLRCLFHRSQLWYLVKK